MADKKVIFVAFAIEDERQSVKMGSCENGVKSALDPCCLIGQDPRGYRSLRIKKKTEKH